MIDPFYYRLRFWHYRRHAVVLTYHSVVPSRLSFATNEHLPVEQFRQQMAYLKKHFRCVTVDTLLCEANAQRLPPRTVAITFDDGFANTLHCALPILAQYDIPVTVFLIAGRLGESSPPWPEQLIGMLSDTQIASIELPGISIAISTPSEKMSAFRAITRRYKHFSNAKIEAELDVISQITGVGRDVRRDDLRLLTWPEARELAEHPLVTIGSHTLLHPRLEQAPDETAHREIVESKTLLERELGAVPYFAYPFGGRTTDYSDRHCRMVAEAGYDAAFSAMMGTIEQLETPFDIPRVSISGGAPSTEFGYLVNGGAAALAHS